VLVLLAVKRCQLHVLLHRGKMLRKAGANRHHRAAVCHGLHACRSRQRVSAEQRQPDGQKYCNEFSGHAQHGNSFAKNSLDVNNNEADTAPPVPVWLNQP
jgi:hypothetical protein